jgi:hypothetical protein
VVVLLPFLNIVEFYIRFLMGIISYPVLKVIPGNVLNVYQTTRCHDCSQGFTRP